MILKFVVLFFIFAYVGAFESERSFLNEDVEDDVADAVSNLLSRCDEAGKRTLLGPCQECICGENLQITCSILEDCNEDANAENNQDTKTKNEKKKPTGNQKCVPRSNFRDECNSCSCSDDGMHIACTKRYCEPGLFKKDGTINKTISEILDSQLSFDPEDGSDDFDIISADKPFAVPIKDQKFGYSVIDKYNVDKQIDDNLVKIEPLAGEDRVQKNWKQLEKYLPSAQTEKPKFTHDELRKK